MALGMQTEHASEHAAMKSGLHLGCSTDHLEKVLLDLAALVVAARPVVAGAASML